MEKLDSSRRPEDRTRLMYRSVVWVSVVVIVGILAYGAITILLAGSDVSSVGWAFVYVGFPVSFFAAPVTYLGIASVTFFYSGLRLWQNKIAMWSLPVLSAIQVIALVIAFASAYEVLYNFMVWGAFLSVQLLTTHLVTTGTIFTISSPGPTPWNLVFATWIFLSLFMISGYIVYFLRRIHRIYYVNEMQYAAKG